MEIMTLDRICLQDVVRDLIEKESFKLQLSNGIFRVLDRRFKSSVKFLNQFLMGVDSEILIRIHICIRVTIESEAFFVGSV